MEEYKCVRSSYAGKQVFITGGTGFLGKMVIFRLLQTCPDVARIFVLIRPTKGKSFEERERCFFTNELLGHLPLELLKSKITCLEGDVMEHKLGLSTKEESLLEHLDIVIHCAAAINFSEPLRLATKINLLGTKHVLELCDKSLKKDILFIHASSYSCWFTYEVLEEEVMEVPKELGRLEPLEFLGDIDSFDEQQLEDFESKYIGFKPPKFSNTYMLTKSLAETLIKNWPEKKVRRAIVRMPFIFSAIKEPQVGWYDGPQTVAAVFNFWATGFLRDIYFDHNTIYDQVPVDICANCMLIAGHELNILDENRTIVRNISALDGKVPTLQEYTALAARLGNEYPTKNMLRAPVMEGHRKTSSRGLIRFDIDWFLKHSLFACFADLLLRLQGQKPKMVQMYAKLKPFFGEISLKLFKQQVTMRTDMFRRYFQSSDLLSAEDRELFYCDPQTIDWDLYLKGHFFRLRRYGLKENDKTISSSQKRFARVLFYNNLLTLLPGLGIAVLTAVCFNWLQMHTG